MRWRTLLLFLFAGTAKSTTESDGEWLTVHLSQGPVRGRKGSTGAYYEFFNIPYATVPKGQDRFKAPLPPPTWLSTFDAIDEGVICLQKDQGMLPTSLKQREECLIVNVFVPDTDEKNLPVVVYFPGGAFQGSYGDLVRYTALVKSKKLIAVTFNYRLGIHGFLCLGTEGAPGNAGMKDQIALLRWVNKNIASFGGNPNDVTISGRSAGSAAVDLVMLSKSAEGLFNKVIPESGVSLSALSLQRDPVENAKSHAKALNFTNVDDIYALEEFYKSASFDLLTSDAFYDRSDSTFLFSPCVERKDGEDVFLDDTPLNILRQGNYKKVPILYGFTNMEGLIRIDKFERWKSAMNEKFSDFLSADLQFEDDDEREEVAKKIKEFYFGQMPVDDTTILSYVDYFSDIMFVYPTLRVVKLHLEAGHDQIYLYEYSFVDDDTPVVPHTNVRGAFHCAQSLAIADGKNLTVRDETNVLEKTKTMKQTIREIWLNFITTGKPIPDGSPLPAWPPVGPNGSPHMSLGHVLELKGAVSEDRARFWDDIYEKNYRQPVPPPKHPPRPHTEL